MYDGDHEHVGLHMPLREDGQLSIFNEAVTAVGNVAQLFSMRRPAKAVRRARPLLHVQIALEWLLHVILLGTAITQSRVAAYLAV